MPHQTLLGKRKQTLSYLKINGLNFALGFSWYQSKDTDETARILRRNQLAANLWVQSSGQLGLGQGEWSKTGSYALAACLAQKLENSLLFFKLATPKGESFWWLVVIFKHQLVAGYSDLVVYDYEEALGYLTEVKELFFKMLGEPRPNFREENSPLKAKDLAQNFKNSLAQKKLPNASDMPSSQGQEDQEDVQGQDNSQGQEDVQGQDNSQGQEGAQNLQDKSVPVKKGPKQAGSCLEFKLLTNE